MLWDLIKDRWEFAVIIFCYVYAWARMLDILFRGEARLFNKRLADFLHDMPDLTIALGSIIALTPQLAASVLAKYVYLMVTR